MVLCVPVDARLRCGRLGRSRPAVEAQAVREVAQLEAYLATLLLRGSAHRHGGEGDGRA
jgi:hypothetical protein